MNTGSANLVHMDINFPQQGHLGIIMTKRRLLQTLEQ